MESMLSSPFNPVGILIHGCNLKAEEWEQIVFGDGNRLGRVSIGIDEAVNRKAALIFWGTGLTMDGCPTESEFTYAQAIGPKLSALAERIKRNPEDLLKYLKQVSFIDRVTKNTTEEIKAAFTECQARGIKELILVSSPTHIARCLQEACKVKEQNPEITIKFYARPSETCFAQSTAADVVIVEPPHRGDRPKVYFNQTVSGIFQFLSNEGVAIAFNDALAKLIEEFNRKL